MKKTHKLQFIILTAVYFAGLLAGCISFFALPYFKDPAGLVEYTAEAAQVFESTGALVQVKGYGLSYIAYDSGGARRAINNSYGSKFVFDIDVDKYLKRMEKNPSALYPDFIDVVNNFPGEEEDSIYNMYALIGTSPYYKDGKPAGMVLLIRDLPEASRNAVGFSILWTAIFVIILLSMIIIRHKENELDNLQRMYIAGMNHELKTPITSIKALSETLADGFVTDPEKQLFYYSTILREANNLEATVQEILELAKLQSVKSIYQKSVVSLDTVFSRILARYNGLCEDLGITFISPSADLAALPTIRTNPAVAERVLDLYLHNALKFTDPEEGRIEVTFRTEKDKLILCVKDNGCGIPAAALPHVFERFYQAQEDRNKTGSGLGLAIVQEIAGGLKEKAWVESQEGRGAAFYFTFSTKA